MLMSGGDLFEIFYFALKTATIMKTKQRSASSTYTRQYKAAASGPAWLRTKGDYFKQ